LAMSMGNLFPLCKVFMLSLLIGFSTRSGAQKPSRIKEKTDSLLVLIEQSRGAKKAAHIKEMVFLLRDVNPAEAARWNRQYLAIAKAEPDTCEYAAALKLMGDVLWDIGMLDSAMYYELEALKIAESEKDTGLIVECLVIMGHIYVDRMEPDRAYEVYKQALPLAKAAGTDAQVGKTLMSIGSCYVRSIQELKETGNDFSRELDSANHYYSEAIRYYTAGNYYKGIALANANKAELACYRGDLAGAIQILKEALVYFKKEQLDNYTQLALENIARHFSSMGQYDSSVVYANLSLEAARKLNTLSDKAYAFSALSDIYQAKKDYEHAFIAKDSALTLRLQLVNEEREKAMLEMESKYEAEKKDLELARVREEQKLERYTRNVFIVYFILLAGFMGLIFEGLRIKMRKQKLEAELEKIKLNEATADLEQKKEQLKLYMDQLKIRNKEIKKLSEDIAKLESMKNHEGEQNLREINQLFNQRILTEEDWMQFRGLFDQAYKGFYEKALKLSDSLTQADLRLLSLCKLGVSNQETADTLGISLDSVKKGRQRLSQKLNLKSARKLDQFVMSI